MTEKEHSLPHDSYDGATFRYSPAQIEKVGDKVEEVINEYGPTSVALVDFVLKEGTDDVLGMLTSVNAVVRFLNQNEHFPDSGGEMIAGSVSNHKPPLKQQRIAVFQEGLDYVRAKLDGASEQSQSAVVLRVLPKLVTYAHMFKDGNGKTARVLENALTDPHHSRLYTEVLKGRGYDRTEFFTEEQQHFADGEIDKILDDMGVDSFEFEGKILDACNYLNTPRFPFEERTKGEINKMKEITSYISSLSQTEDIFANNLRFDTHDTLAAIHLLNKGEHISDRFDLDHFMKDFYESYELRSQFELEYGFIKRLRALCLVDQEIESAQAEA